MAAPIQKLAQLSAKIFGSLSPDKITADHLTHLARAMNNITADDVFFDPREIEDRDAKLQLLGQDAPVTFMHIHEDNQFAMAVFILKSGGVLPLHDHPGMHGLVKVISGQVKIVSYSGVDHKPIPDGVRRTIGSGNKNIKTVRRHNDVVLSAEDGCSVLTPSVENFHEIRPVTPMAAFLDILAPPYENSSSCHYYKELTGAKAGSTTWLLEIPHPAHYWCDTIKYKGPVLLKH